MFKAIGNVNVAVGEIIRHTITPAVLPILERNLVPDAVIRFAIQRELEMELQKINKLTVEEKAEKTRLFVEELKKLPIAIQQEKANEQHYEVPDEFYYAVLGPYLKYSSGFWKDENTTLAESEIYMLDLYVERAGIVDGMSVIDLGCGWGSVSLYLASRFPNCEITSVSNSHSQKAFIMGKAAERGYKNINVYTGDINTFDLPEAEFYGKADRVISIEMFEHMKNYELLLEKVSNWLKPEGKLFIHIFTHKDVPGHYEKGWMTDNFFSGGTLPSDSLLLYFPKHMSIEQHWLVNGTHYQKTLEAWCALMDSKKKEVLPILERAYGVGQGVKWYVNW
eukprot:CAMPEP_0119050946 /NCGR_PEP_ID=MMETSP1177-20130426/72720_1 /TAXON_ID=2985 /ORGANISM="Ochromonas sp, Strain CCMP1899" /LENGTH=335 /DNA_ID=CAMNT_0007029973 /DNA_START=102 /DNA_END=1106 /DNA_ORIENTATION=-